MQKKLNEFKEMPWASLEISVPATAEYNNYSSSEQ